MSEIKKNKLAVLGSGSGSNMQAILDAINGGELNCEIVCVISDVKDAYILERARNNGIPASYLSAAPYKTKLEGEAEQLYIKTIMESGAEMVILAGFIRIIKQGMLDAFPDRILNIHPSLLPAFPGMSAWKQALDYGVKVAGCTVHLVDSGMDTGPIIVQKTVPVLDDDTAETLHARIQTQEYQAYPEAIRTISDKMFEIKGRRVINY